MILALLIRILLIQQQVQGKRMIWMDNLVNTTTKRNLDMNDKEEMETGHEVADATGMEYGAMLTDDKDQNTIAVGAKDTECNKRRKKDGADSPSLGSAGSLEGSVRSQ
jgi:hypothetical protein